jgi:hypothetical protein
LSDSSCLVRADSLQNFGGRLNKLLLVAKIADERGDFDHDLMHTLTARVKNRQVRNPVELTREQDALVAFIRGDLLGLEAGDQIWDDKPGWHKKWIASSEKIERFIRFTAYVRANLRDFQRTFSVAPVHDVARRFLHVDERLLLRLVRVSEIYDKEEFIEHTDEMFERVFNQVEETTRARILPVF